MEFWDHIVGVCLQWQETAKHPDKVILLFFYILAIVSEFQLLYFLPTYITDSHFKFSFSFWCVMVSHYGLICISLITKEIMHLYVLFDYSYVFFWIVYLILCPFLWFFFSVVGELYIFLIQVLCQMYSFQTLSSQLVIYTFMFLFFSLDHVKNSDLFGII